MGSPTATEIQPTSYCPKCGAKLSAGAKFCPKCGAPASAAPPRASSGVTLSIPQANTPAGGELATLEESVARNPNDETVRKLLAVALHDDAMKDWWCDPEAKDNKKWLCVSLEGLNHSRKQLERASALKFNDPALRKQIDESLRLVDSMAERKFSGTWLMVVVLGFFYFIPGILWWYVNRRPRYLINRDYMTHYKTGKHSVAAAKMGGLQTKVYDFFEKIGGDWGWLMGLFFMLTVGVVLSPIFMVMAYKENYIDTKKAAA